MHLLNIGRGVNTECFAALRQVAHVAAADRVSPTFQACTNGHANPKAWEVDREGWNNTGDAKL